MCGNERRGGGRREEVCSKKYIYENVYAYKLIVDASRKIFCLPYSRKDRNAKILFRYSSTLCFLSFQVGNFLFFQSENARAPPLSLSPLLSSLYISPCHFFGHRLQSFMIALTSSPKTEGAYAALSSFLPPSLPPFLSHSFVEIEDLYTPIATYSNISPTTTTHVQ